MTDNTYLNVAVDRIVAMYKLVLATTPMTVTQVVKYVDTGLTMPYLWLYPGVVRATDQSAHDGVQVYVVNAEVRLGMILENFDGKLAGHLWVVIPAVLNYFNQRRNLCHQAGQDEPPGLMEDETRINLATGFGQFAGTQFVGIRFEHTVAFTGDVTPAN